MVKMGISWVLSWMVVGCAAPVDGEVGATRAAIFDGDLTADHEAVVAIWRTTGVLCTGVVIGPRHVLTAKQCFGTEEPFATDAEVMVGSGLGAFDTRSYATTVHHLEGPIPVVDGRLEPVDNRMLSIVVTEEDLGVEPLPVAPELGIAAPVTVLGFGLAGDGLGGHRHAADGFVTWTAHGAFVVSGHFGVCENDAGGPALDDTGRVVGIAINGGCESERGGLYVDVTAYHDFLRAHVPGLDLPERVEPPPSDEVPAAGTTGWVGLEVESPDLGGDGIDPGEAPGDPTIDPDDRMSGSCAVISSAPRAPMLPTLLLLVALTLRRRRR